MRPGGNRVARNSVLWLPATPGWTKSPRGPALESPWDVDEVELLNYAYPAVIAMTAVVIVLTWIDPEYEGESGIQAMKWLGSASVAFLVSSIRGYPAQVTAYVGATTLLWVTVFTGFRPGLLITLPRPDDDGSWIRYPNLYRLTGWIGVGWVVYLLYPLLDMYA